MTLGNPHVSVHAQISKFCNCDLRRSGMRSAKNVLSLEDKRFGWPTYTLEFADHPGTERLVAFKRRRTSRERICLLVRHHSA